MRKTKLSYALKTYVTENQISYETLAEQLEIPLSTFYKWTCGYTTPSRKRLKKVCELLDLNPDWILNTSVIEKDVYRIHLSIESLNLKYVKCLQYDELQAKDYVAFAATALYNFMIKHNILCSLEIDCNGDAKIHKLNSSHNIVQTFTIFGGPDSICISPEGASSDNYFKFDKLTNNYLNSFVKMINRKEI